MQYTQKSAFFPYLKNYMKKYCMQTFYVCMPGRERNGKGTLVLHQDKSFMTVVDESWCFSWGLFPPLCYTSILKVVFSSVFFFSWLVSNNPASHSLLAWSTSSSAEKRIIQHQFENHHYVMHVIYNRIELNVWKWRLMRIFDFNPWLYVCRFKCVLVLQDCWKSYAPAAAHYHHYFTE